MMKAEEYEAWYGTPRGAWIAAREFALMMRLLRPEKGTSLLDVGCGTGQFSRRFAAYGLRVAGLDPDAGMLHHARSLAGGVDYIEGRSEALPFADTAFDYCAAVTSLCFVQDPARALAEMWRVARRAVVLGLLNRHSLLYHRKRGRGGYAGARWDRVADVRRWAAVLSPPPKMRWGSAVFLPGGGPAARLAERLLPARLPWGGFLAVVLEKP